VYVVDSVRVWWECVGIERQRGTYLFAVDSRVRFPSSDNSDTKTLLLCESPRCVNVCLDYRFEIVSVSLRFHLRVTVIMYCTV
jgi:hypothetical protein